MQQPPLLPEEVLIRVLRTSRLNGMSVLVAAAFFAVVSAVSKDFIGTITGLIVAGAGAMEVHGSSLLHAGDRRGLSWLLTSQFVCLLAILAYCGVRLVIVELPPIPEEIRPVIEFDAKQLGLTADEFLRRMYELGVYLVATVSLIYQGGMALYYTRRRPGVLRALSDDEAAA